jgi:SulP family sulfate permease
MTYVEGVSNEISDETDDPGEIDESRRGRRVVSGHEIPADVEVYEVNGPFFFGAADKIKDVLNEIARPPKVFILRMRNVPAIDATGIHALEQMAMKCKHDGTTMILTEIRQQPLRAIVRAGKLEVFGGRQNLAKSLDVALERAGQVLGS